MPHAAWLWVSRTAWVTTSLPVYAEMSKSHTISSWGREEVASQRGLFSKWTNYNHSCFEKLTFSHPVQNMYHTTQCATESAVKRGFTRQTLRWLFLWYLPLHTADCHNLGEYNSPALHPCRVESWVLPCLLSPSLASLDRQLPSLLLSHALPSVIHPLTAPLHIFLSLQFPTLHVFLLCLVMFFSLLLPLHILQHVHEYTSLPSSSISKFLIISWLTSQNTTSTYCSCQYPNNNMSTSPCLAPLSWVACYLISQQQLTCILLETTHSCQS